MEIALRTLKLSHLFYSTISQGKRLFGEFEDISLINFCLNGKRPWEEGYWVLLKA